jgi:hypothetical protein
MAGLAASGILKYFREDGRPDYSARDFDPRHFGFFPRFA